MPYDRPIANRMTLMLIGSFFFAVDSTWGSWQSYSYLAENGVQHTTTSGWAHDWIPDEVGHLFFLIAFFTLGRACRGAARAGAWALFAMQLVSLAGTLLDHRIIGTKPMQTSSPEWIKAWNALFLILLGWVLAGCCRSLQLEEGARRWTRLARWVTGVVGLIAVAAILFQGQVRVRVNWPIHITQPGEFVGFAIVLAAGLFFLYLWVSACRGTRAEALTRAI